MVVYIVEHKDGAFTFWINPDVIKAGVHQKAKVFEVDDNFTVGELIDYIATKETKKMKELKELV